MSNPSSCQLARDPRLLLAFGFGSGLSPIMPGTVGSLAAVPFFFLLTALPLWLYVMFVLATLLLGIHLCGYAAQKLQVHDHPGIVWDEFVGLWISLFWLPVGWHWLLLGFVLFRIFDMVKPWPIRWVDKQIHGGLGIMLDDVLAGVLTWLCIQGLALLSLWRMG